MTAKEYLTAHGITQKTADRLGITVDAHKLAIPVKDSEGEFLFYKYRHLNWVKGGTEPKFTYSEENHGASLYNCEVIKNATGIVICEGEPDVARLVQAGIPAVCSTSGALTFEEEWVPLFNGKKVFLCFDNDDAGREGAAKLQEMFPMALLITLPKEYKDICDFLLVHKNAEFSALIQKVIDENLVTFEKLCTVVDKWLLLPDKNVIKVTLGTIIAHFLDSDPLWLMLVAPPSGTKTEIINCLNDLPFIYSLSDLTPQTFASGMPGKVDPSLLPKLSNQVLTMKDFTTVLNMREESKAMILSQLREIYDGKYSKEFGTGKRVEWEGKLGLIVGVTSIVDKYSSVFQVMGERFILYRIPQPLDEEMAFRSITNSGSEKEMRSELRVTFRKFFGNITIPDESEVELPEPIARAIASLASFAVIARSGIIRDMRKQIELIPVPEAPGRLAKQLGILIKALAILERRKTVTWTDFFLVLKVAFDVIPQNRTKHIAALAKTSQWVTYPTSTVAEMTSYSHSGSEIALEDLNALELFGVKRQGVGRTNEWYLSEKSRGYWKNILTCPDEEVENIWKIFPKGMTHYDPIIEMMIALKNGTADKIEVEDLDELPPEIV